MVPSRFVELDSAAVDHDGQTGPPGAGRHRAGRPSSPRSGYVAPRNEQERLLANIFSDVLRLDQVGINDDFFQLGGHSLSATRAASRIDRVFGVHCPVKSIFEHPRIADLAPFVQGLLAGGAAPRPALVPSGARDRLPLSFAQERLWFLDRFESVGESCYHMPAAFLLAGPLDVSALRQELRHADQRHQGLRTVFRDEGGEPYRSSWSPSRRPGGRREVQDGAGGTSRSPGAPPVRLKDRPALPGPPAEDWRGPARPADQPASHNRRRVVGGNNLRGTVPLLRGVLSRQKKSGCNRSR